MEPQGVREEPTGPPLRLRHHCVRTSAARPSSLGEPAAVQNPEAK